MKTKFNLVASAALVLLSTINRQVSTALAQGTAFTYQGQLQNGGAPADGSYDFRFRLASDPLADNYVGSSFLTNGIPISNGLFTAIIDFGPGIFTGSNYWLEVDVRTNGGASYTALSPLQMLTPTPYAIFADGASNLLGVLSAGQLIGPVSNGNLPSSPTVSGTVTAGSFSGDGSSVTNVNAATLGGLSASNFWQLGGNTISGGQFLGTLNGQPMDLYAGGVRAMRLILRTDASGTYSNAPNVIGGSSLNQIKSTVVGGTVGGGGGNLTNGFGYANQVLADFGTVAGGGLNTASSPFATVAGGSANSADGTNSTVGGGYFNNATGDYSTVAGGSGDSAQGAYSIAAGGQGNIAMGVSSFAAGNSAIATNDGSFVWSDNTGTFTSDASSNQFVARASGGFFFYTGTGSSGAKLAAGATSWTATCDRNAKKNFQPVDTVAVLNKLAAVPIERWNYKWEKDGDTPNIGPMAQDFKAAFYPGRDDKGISTLEFDGVELAAIQGLNQKVEAGGQKSEAGIQNAEVGIQRSEARIQKLEQTLEQKETEITELKARLEKLEQRIGSKTEVKEK